MNTRNHKSLSAITLTALKWNYAGTAAHAVSSLVIGIILARILGPEPFGLVAIALVVTGLGNLIANFGMGAALVQRKTISDRDIRYTFTIQICIGFGLMAILALCAPVFAHAFRQPKAIPVVRALSLMFVLQAFGLTSVSLLKREIDFKSIQSAEICSYLVGFLVLGIPLAFWGCGVWSLVVAQLSQKILLSTICFFQVRHPMRPLFITPSRGLFHFGSTVLLTNIMNWTINNIGNFFIGRFFDVVTLGLYNRSHILVYTPMRSLVQTVQHVMFSSYSRVQNDLQTVRRVYLACVECLAVLMIPAYGCMALVPTTVIHGLFGDQWGAAIPLLVPLALAMPFHAMMGMGGPMLWSQNMVGREFRAQLFTALIFLVVLFITSRFSVIALSWGVLGISIFRFVLITHASLRAVGASWSNLINSMSGGIVLLIPTAGMVLGIDHTVASLHDSVILRLTVDVVVGTVTLLGVVLCASKLIFSSEFRWLATRLTGRFPVLIQPLLTRMFPSI
jgi:O-antigen/teichoic acid export membrane protein